MVNKNINVKTVAVLVHVNMRPSKVYVKSAKVVCFVNTELKDISVGNVKEVVSANITINE